MYVSLKRNESKQNFSIWVYGDKSLVRGSGLHIGASGIAVSHHFLAPEKIDQFKFSQGTYHLEVFAQLLGNNQTLRLFQQELVVSEMDAKALEDEDCGLYFDWGPDAGKYLPHIDKKRMLTTSEEILRALEMGRI